MAESAGAGPAFESRYVYVDSAFDGWILLLSKTVSGNFGSGGAGSECGSVPGLPSEWAASVCYAGDGLSAGIAILVPGMEPCLSAGARKREYAKKNPIEAAAGIRSYSLEKRKGIGNGQEESRSHYFP